MARDPEIQAHQEWLGYLQPVGLVVSPPALVAAQAVLNRNIVAEQQSLLALVDRDDPAGDGAAVLRDLPSFCANVLGWEPADLVPAAHLPADLEVVLPDYGETLSPTWAVPGEAGATRPSDRWLLLVREYPPGTDLDDPGPSPDHGAGHGWHASPQAKFERLLRETQVPVGLLTNGRALRLVYAPRGESSGHVTFPVQAMTEVAGRSILSALHLLLSAERLFTVPTPRRLRALLEQSRKYQNEVSTELSEQVLRALNELLRGFQAADETHPGELLAVARADDPQHIYGGLLTTLMRLVFLLYAEERGLLPSDPVYVEHYGVTGLFERLRQDADRNPDTMDQRFGAWSRLLALFRLIHDGGGHADLRLPARRGDLFNPDRYPFLEGRPYRVARIVGEPVHPPDPPIDPPRVSDGVVLRVLEDLLVLRGERLSYRALDVEQIGSVYEAMMGFQLEVATGPSIAVRPDHVVVDLADLLQAKGADRAKRLEERANARLSGRALDALKSAETVAALVAALDRKLSPRTPRVLPAGALYLQPSEERRRSGSHYTPRSLTEPIVRTTLRPVLEALGPRPRSAAILGLKVCDPAMGSGAFLVEACRQLSEVLVEAWDRHGETPGLPPDEDPLLHARRLIAQRCLYGVDKNPYAVGLAKLSLWLVTLAKDHPFTFVDHALRHGDSLVGLTREQIERFHWDAQKGDRLPLLANLGEDVKRAQAHRDRLIALGDEGERDKRDEWDAAQKALKDARLTGDLLVAAFFAAEKPKAREEKRHRYQQLLADWRAGVVGRGELEALVVPLREGARPVPAFHWEIEFPEVFGRENGGFDAVVGNPPFLGGTMISTHYGRPYVAALVAATSEAGNRTDLVAYFFRRAFSIVRTQGAQGLIATKTIAQGDTRRAGLGWVSRNGGRIYAANRRLKWPGQAAVTVSVVFVAKGAARAPYELDGKLVQRITAFLFHRGTDDEPAQILSNAGRSFAGVKPYAEGFLFEDGNPAANPRSLMDALIRKDHRNAERILPYVGGTELTRAPDQSTDRYIIYLSDMTLQEANLWPDLLDVLRARIPEQRKGTPDLEKWPWWLLWRARREMFDAVNKAGSAIVIARTSEHALFSIGGPGIAYNENVVVFSLPRPAFPVLQSRVHHSWVGFTSSTLEDRQGYRPSDCFETFPFPPSWESDPQLEAAGQAYYDFRAALMIRNNEGLTATYNRFHDPDERDPDILRLRALHAAMDRAVLDAYSWADVPTDCAFLLDYEEPEDDDEGPTRRRKKPWRYRWPDAVRDDVLARLLDLNQKRAEEERLLGAAAEQAAAAAKPKGPAKGKGRRRKDSANLELF